MGDNNPHSKTCNFLRNVPESHGSGWILDSFAGSKHRKMYMRFVTWKVRSLSRAGSLKMKVREFGKCKLDLEGVHEVRWEGSTERAEDYTFFYGQGNGDHQLGSVFLYIRESYQRLGQ
jgi:hypothetical protein